MMPLRALTLDRGGDLGERIGGGGVGLWSGSCPAASCTCCGVVVCLWDLYGVDSVDCGLPHRGGGEDFV